MARVFLGRAGTASIESYSGKAISAARGFASEEYQPQFDGLRALAVLTVLIDHFSAGVPNFPLP
ncbi:MAG TPA: hypothetical protein VFA58_06820, partial [Chthoniobacterales bacterium]|nr:hypothetical protein [Chthoniobacterales bacterium]